MNTDRVRRLDVLCTQLTGHMTNAALCAKEIASIVDDIREGVSCLHSDEKNRESYQRPVGGRPILDESTLSVFWNGRLLHLGHTQGFWLLARLTRSANQYVTHLDLIQGIWDDEFTDTTVLRAGMRRLRLKLRRGGMGDLADAIVGHHGRYMLVSPPRHTNVTPPSE